MQKRKYTQLLTDPFYHLVDVLAPSASSTGCIPVSVGGIGRTEKK